MIATLTKKPIFKFVAVFVSVVFLWDQVVWASELAESTIERLNNQQTQLFAPSYLQSREETQSALVSQMQATEDAMNTQSLVISSNIEAPQEETADLKGPAGGSLAPGAQVALASGEDPLAGSGPDISVTTQAGDVIHYVNGVIDRVEQADGTILRNIVVDEADNLLRADIVYTDGTTQVVEGGRLVRALRPDGTVINYDSDGRIVLVAYAAGTTVTYTYVEDVSGNVIETVLTNSNGTVSRYDANGKLSKVTKPDGTVIEYSSGILSKITRPDGKVFVFGQTTATVDDRTETTVTLKTYIDETGNSYSYSNGVIVSIKVRQNGMFYSGSLNTAGFFNTGNIILADGTNVFVTQGVVTTAIFTDGSRAIYIRPTPGVVFVDILKNGQTTHYEFNGDNQLLRDPAGVIYSYVKGLITKKVASLGATTNYIREVDLLGNPSRVTVQAPGQPPTVYLYNKDTGVFAKETSGTRNASYFNFGSTQITVSNMHTGVTVTDGRYLYIQKYDTVLKTDTFVKVGTGLGGTITGRIYGTIAASPSGLSAVYYSDGFIYKATLSPYTVEKINVATGSRCMVNIPAGLVDFSRLPPGSKALMTSDGRYIYNAANYIGTGMFNGWTVKVFDPQNGWQLVKTYTVGNASYSTSGIMSDGIFLYFINQASGNITASRLSDGAVIMTYNKPSAMIGAMNCQYDWVNNKFWFGSNLSTKVYSYNGLIQRLSPSSAELEDLFTPTTKFKQVKDILNCELTISLPSMDFLNSSIGYSKLVYGSDFELVSVQKYDGTKFAFTGGAVSSVTDRDGNIVEYSYDYSEFDTVLDINVVRDGIKRFYDLKGELKSVTTADNTTVTYSGNTVSSVAYADGTTLLYSGGRVDEAVDKDGTRFTLGLDGRPMKAVDKYGNEYIYSYSIDISGRNITIIEDKSRFETRRYVDGVLIRAESSDGSISENSYYADGRLEEVRVSRLGRIINIYLYTYSADGTTAVSDIDENIRTYGGDGRLLTLTDVVGNVYQYSYPDSVTTRMELVQYNGPQGADDLVVAQDFINNILRSVYRANGTVTSYTLDGKIDYVSNFENDILVDYEYDDGGNITAMVMAGARRDLGRSVEDARNNIEEQRAQALAQLASQRGIVIGQIDSQIAPDLNNLIAQRNSLRSQWNNLDNTDCGWDPFGTARREKSRNLDAIGRAIAQVEAALSQVYAQLAAAYAEVDSEVALLKAQIDAQAEASLVQIKAKEDELEFNISKQEAAAFVLYCYRTTLGRDPDQAEVDGWVAKLSSEHQQIDRSEIVGAIVASAEYITLKENITRIKQDVRTIIDSYLSDMDPAEKSAFLAALGLTQDDVVALTHDDLEKILGWIDSQGMHFGQSAFYALENILKSSGIDSNIEEVAATTILIDILAGSIDVFTNGDLQISMYALSKFAETKGVSLYNTKLTFEGLTALQTSGSQLQAIAHIDGNHYIVITGIDGDTIHYREENRGASGTSEVMSKSDFLKKWSGFTITKTAPQDTGKIISDAQAKKVRGAFFFFLAPLIGAIVSAITGVVAGIVSAVTTIVAGVIGVVSTALANVATFIATAGSQLLSGIGAAFTGIGQMVGTFFGSSLLGTALNTAVSIGLSIGIQTGLEALGVNSTISSLTGAFLTGGVLGLLNPAKGLGIFGSFMSGALKYATVAGINELAPRLNLDPSISGILSITAGALVDGFWQGDIAGKLVKIAPNVAGEFAYYGVTKLGAELGIDSSISYLAGIGIRSSINMGLSGANPEEMWTSVKNGLLQGVTNLGLEWISQRLDIPPIITSLAGAAIVGGLEALLEGRNPIQGIFDTYFKAGVGLLTLGGDGGTNPWLRAAYMSQVLDFSQIVQERGIVSALESYATGFLNQTTINEIWKKGGIADLVTNSAEVVVNGEGQTVKRVWVDKNNKGVSAYIDLDLQTDNLRGFKQIFSDGGYEIADCDYVVGPDGKPQAKNEIRTRYDVEGNPIMKAVTQLFNLVKVEFFDNAGLVTDEMTPIDGKTGIELDSKGDPTNARIKSYKYNEEIFIKDGIEQQRISKGLSRFSSEDKQRVLTDLNLTEADASNIIITETRDTTGKVVVGLTYNQADRPEKIGASDWFDIALSADGKERIYNANHFFGYRTNVEIAANRQSKINLMMTDSRVGDTLIINGRGFSADTIKIVTDGPANHTAMMFIDDSGEKWVMEMPGPMWFDENANLRFTKASVYADHLNEIDSDLEIGRRNDLTSEDLSRMSSLIGDLFYNKGRTVKEIKDSNGQVITIIKDVSYNTANLFTIPGDTKRTFICSSLIEYVYDETGKPLVDKPQLQISPVDIRNGFEEKGELR